MNRLEPDTFHFKDLRGQLWQVAAVSALAAASVSSLLAGRESASSVLRAHWNALKAETEEENPNIRRLGNKIGIFQSDIADAGKKREAIVSPEEYRTTIARTMHTQWDRAKNIRSPKELECLIEGLKNLGLKSDIPLDTVIPLGEIFEERLRLVPREVVVVEPDIIM